MWVVVYALTLSGNPAARADHHEVFFVAGHPSPTPSRRAWTKASVAGTIGSEE